METPTYRWIIYMHTPLPGQFEVDCAASLREAKEKLSKYGEATGFYGQCTASLYPYSREDWIIAMGFASVGNPFDYPSKLIERGPKGGMKVVDA